MSCRSPNLPMLSSQRMNDDDYKRTVHSGLVLHHGVRRNRLRRTRKAMGSFHFAIPSAFRPRLRGRCVRAGSEGIPSNGFSAPREAGFSVFRGFSADCLCFNLACNLTGRVPSGLVLHHGAHGNRLRRTRKAMGNFRFAIPSAFRPRRRGRFVRAGSEGIPSNGFSVPREAGCRVRTADCLRFNPWG